MAFKEIKSDILIIGGGGAAARAALAARRAGAQVVIVSKESSLVGGATIMAAGGTGAIFEPQDNPDIFFNDIIKGGHNLNNPVLVDILANRATSALYKLEEFGFVLDRSGMAVKNTEGHTFRRSYLDRREAQGFCHALGKAFMGSGVTFYPDTAIFKLAVHSGRVIGALGFNLRTGGYVVFNAKAVILTTGGFGAIYEVTTNPNSLTGDGCAMAWDIGAELIDMEMVQFLPICVPYPKSRRGTNIGMSSHFGSQVKLLNGLGERYMSKYDPVRKEFATRDICARANYTEIMEGRGTKNGTIVVDPRGADPEYIKKMQTFMPRIFALIREVYGEKAYNMEEPFEAIPSQHFCMGGLKIDENCRTNISGLFAAGEAAGGLHGANRLANTALAAIHVFGDIAGEQAAKDVRNMDFIPVDKKNINSEIGRIEEVFARQKKGGIRPFEIKQAIKKNMWDYLGPVRSESGIQNAISNINDIRKNSLPQMVLGSQKASFNRERLEAIEVNLMLETAQLVANAALTRKESRGSHYMKDYPEQNDKEWLKNIVLSKGEDGGIKIKFSRLGVPANKT